MYAFTYKKQGEKEDYIAFFRELSNAVDYANSYLEDYTDIEHRFRSFSVLSPTKYSASYEDIDETEKYSLYEIQTED